MLTKKIQTLNEYSEKYNVPQTVHNKIRKYFENQAKMRSNDGDWEVIFSELPPSL